MNPIIDSLERLSEAACEALPLLEKYDYRKESDDLGSEKLELTLMPKHLQDIVKSLMMFCSPISYNGERIPDDALLDSENLQIFIENLEISGDRTVLRQFNHIDLEPIKDIVPHFEQLGLARQARLLENIYNFADELRSNGRTNSIRPKSSEQAPIQINVTLAPDELTDEQLEAAKLFKEFNNIFRSGVLYPAQRRAIFDAFRNILKDENTTKPHLVIIAAICLMMTYRSYGKPLTGKFNHIRETVFTSLGQPSTTGKSYRENSLKQGVTPSLLIYKQQAQELLQAALGNTK